MRVIWGLFLFLLFLMFFRTDWENVGGTAVIILYKVLITNIMKRNIEQLSPWSRTPTLSTTGIRFLTLAGFTNTSFFISPSLLGMNLTIGDPSSSS